MVDTARYWKTYRLVDVQCLIVSNFSDFHIEFSLPVAVSINCSGLDKTEDDRGILQADFLYMVFMDHKRVQHEHFSGCYSSYFYTN